MIIMPKLKKNFALKLVFRKLFLFLFLLSFSHNVMAQDKIVNKKNYVFNYPYKKVWAAAQIVLGSYPLETNDLEAGLMVTASLKSGEFWQAPFESQISDNYSQTLSFQFSKPNAQNTQLQITKKAIFKTDFFGSEKEVMTQPWEELRLVYKIKREIEIKNILERRPMASNLN